MVGRIAWNSKFDEPPGLLFRRAFINDGQADHFAMNAARQNLNFQLGLLHFAHLMARVDGIVDKREVTALDAIRREEQIPDGVFHSFESLIATRSNREIYEYGLQLLSTCNEDERLRALVHLYRISAADQTTHVKEAKFLLLSLKVTDVSFRDIELSARLAGVKRIGS